MFLHREWRVEESRAVRPLRIGTWNVLADACADGGFEPTPPHMDWPTRSARALAIIDEAGPFDVLALVECDHYTDFWEPAMRERGMTGEFARKLVHRTDHGVAIFVRNALLVSSAVVTDGVAGVGVLIDYQDAKCCVVATHLRAKEPRAAERIVQMDTLIDHFAPVSHAVDATIVLGDFNAPIGEECVMKACSAFAVDALFRPAWTTWKRRNGHVVKRTIDHMLASSRLVCLQWLDVPEDAVVGDDALPGSRYTSDHIMLVADVVLGE